MAQRLSISASASTWRSFALGLPWASSFCKTAGGVPLLASLVANVIPRAWGPCFLSATLTFALAKTSDTAWLTAAAAVSLTGARHGRNTKGESNSGLPLSMQSRRASPTAGSKPILWRMPPFSVVYSSSLLMKSISEKRSLAMSPALIP
jgi:hypothetical protein